MWTRRAVLAACAVMAAAFALPPRKSQAATDQLRIGLQHEPPHLDSTAGADPATLAVSYQNIFEGLTRIDERGAVQPCLAKSWTVSTDGLSCDFVLQTEARYHDGASFDAGHVIFALERLLAPGSQSPNRQLYATIADVTVVDEFTVRIRLRQPDADLPQKLARPDAAIVAPESADNNRTVPLGTGPFAFVEWDAGRSIVLERNEDYWGTHPRISQVSFLFPGDPAAAVAALLASQLDGYPDCPAPEALGPLRGNAAFRIVTGKRADGTPRIGAWNAGLEGMWADAPVEGCMLQDIRWAADG